ncbi:MAG TPA: hypothetical protein VKW06_11680 [Candidatus Angelobacter sp.]|nr:hypothetical protein [Candidatus Angelobacter sp.]
MRAIALGLLLAVFLVGNHRQQQHPQSSDIQRTSQHSPTKTVTPIAQFASTEKKQSTYQTAKNYLWKAFGPEYLAAWVLVLAAGVGLCATFRTLRVLRDQTTATRNSVDLQRAAMRQWLRISDWRTDTPFPNKDFIRLSCDIVNPTNMRLTVRNVEFRSTYWNMPPYDAQWTLAPGGVCLFQIPGIQFAGKILEEFEKGILEFDTLLRIDFDDAFGQRESERFSRKCICGRNRPCSTSPPGQTNTEKPKENPN